MTGQLIILIITDVDTQVVMTNWAVQQCCWCCILLLLFHGIRSEHDGVLVVNTWDFADATRAAYHTLQTHSALDAVEEVKTCFEVVFDCKMLRHLLGTLSHTGMSHM